MWIIALLAGFLIPLVVLGPLLSRVRDAAVFRRPAVPEVSERQAMTIRRAFVPLELDEAPMRWPSELPQQKSPVVELPWPSEAWDDEVFGRSKAAIAARAKAAAAAPPPPQPQHQHQPAPKAKQAQQAQQAQRQAPPKPAPEPESAPRADNAHNAHNAAAFFDEDDAPPSDDDVRAIIRDQGIVKAAELVMQATGWDLSRTTKYLRGLATR